MSDKQTPKEFSADLWRERAEKAEADCDRLREALESIANNTCCEGCQEAARVARNALGGRKRD